MNGIEYVRPQVAEVAVDMLHWVALQQDHTTCRFEVAYGDQLERIVRQRRI